MFLEEIQKIYPEMRAIREDIHRHPELSFQEKRTSALVRAELEKYGLDEVRTIFNTGVTGLLRGTAGTPGAGRCLAIRADMDALPVTEETGLPYASENPGVMHACGHDLHTTILLAAARVLAAHRDQLAGTIRFIFQPAEESASPRGTDGGAKPLVQAGVLEDPHVDAVIALHVVPSLEHRASFGLRAGIASSGFDIFTFKLHGNGGHGSQPQTTNDPILAVSQLVVLLQQIVARNVDPNETAVLTVGLINGGTAVNIIPGEASCSGVSRFYNNEVGATIRERCRSIARGVESLSGCHIDVNVLEGYACVNNDTALISQIESSLDAELGPEGHFRLASPFSASEDFSAYGSTGLPLALMWLHGTPEGGTVYPLHHPKCTLKSDLIPTGAAGLCRIAVDYLRGPEV